VAFGKREHDEGPYRKRLIDPPPVRLGQGMAPTAAATLTRRASSG
jgi:hypothetical protein